MKHLKNILTLTVITLLTGCAEGTSENKPVSEGQDRPNILWLVAEDLSPRFSFYGDSTAHTPAIDGIAAKGIVFDNAFTVSGVCAPSRSSIITGCYPNSIGTQHMRQKEGVIALEGVPRYNAVPPEVVKAFPELLRAEGYWTASYRKLDYQFGTPFTVWDSVSERPHWRDRPEAAKKKPFFVYNTFEITHEINIWPDARKKQFFEDYNLDVSKLALDVQTRPALDSMGHRITPDMVQVPPYLPDTPLVRDHLVRHYYNVMRMDQQIAGILKDLEEDGLEDDTIIFFLSDHGDCIPRGKRWILDSGTKSPLVMYIPEKWLPEGMQQTGRDDNLYSFVDLAPTVLELAGIEVPEWIQGKSIVSTLQETPREYVYAARDRMDNRYDIRRAVRDDRYRFIRNFNPEVPYQQSIKFLEMMPMMQEILTLKEQGALNEVQAAWLADSKPEFELYDIKADPFETVNLAYDPEFEWETERLKAALDSWMSSIDDLYEIDEQTQAELAWPDGIQPQTSEVAFQETPQGLALSCETGGASIAYRLKDQERWEIYTNPLDIDPKVEVEAKAVRYGYKSSTTTSYSKK